MELAISISKKYGILLNGQSPMAPKDPFGYSDGKCLD
jgi:hypothetical protein